MSPGRVSLNVDLGERGVDHPVDLALLDHADLVNVACGGHAGSAASARSWAGRAAARGVGVTAHLSYPDPVGFGRRPMRLPPPELADALSRQRDRLPGVDAVKLHGALYHAADADEGVAAFLTGWLRGAGFRRVLTPGSGALAASAAAAGLAVVPEAFADRRYTRASGSGRPVLLGRGHAGAVLGPAEAEAQARRLLRRGQVLLHPDAEPAAVAAGTLCVHGDHPDAAETAARVAGVLREPPA